MSRLPEVNEVVYVRAVVSQVLPAHSPGAPPTVLVRVLNNEGAIDHWRVFAADLGVEPGVIVFPKEKIRWRGT